MFICKNDNKKKKKKKKVLRLHIEVKQLKKKK